jgi:hypothetical protein
VLLCCGNQAIFVIQNTFLPRFLGNVTFTNLMLVATLFGLHHVKDKGIVFTTVTACEE